MRARSCGEKPLLAYGVPEREACLVLDVDLPGVGGIELKKTLAAAGRDLPAIFITALDPTQVDAPLAVLAPVAVLYKPFDQQDLLAAIGRARALPPVRRPTGEAE
jgi:FixJ family two-component response regulator